MSMNRDAAIGHFAAQKYAGKTIAEAWKTAPHAARAGLHVKDIQWIERHGDTDAFEAVQRLRVRNINDPEGQHVTPQPRGIEAQVVLRVDVSIKNRWVRESRTDGMVLQDWLMSRIERAESA